MCCGIRGNANVLLREYHSQRKQYVDIDDTFSEYATNNNPLSLPQGSNLGPLLFLICIKDIFNLNSKLKLNGIIILFADDAVLNADKTKYMLIK